MDLIQSNAITTLHRLASVEDVVQFVRLCVEKNLVIDFILKEELDAFIKPTNNSGSWVRQQIDGVRVKAVDRNGFTVYAIWMRESLMKDYVTYLESITKTLADASVFSFPVIWILLLFLISRLRILQCALFWLQYNPLKQLVHWIRLLGIQSLACG